MRKPFKPSVDFQKKLAVAPLRRDQICLPEVLTGSVDTMLILKYMYMYRCRREHSIQKITRTDLKGLFKGLLESIEIGFDKMIVSIHP